MLLGLRRTATSSTMIDSLKRLPDQLRSVLQDRTPLNLSISLQTIDKVVINGMGGSNLGGYILQSVFRDRFTIPVLIEAGYTVPAYVNKKTLYILSSYSGTTEEPLQAYKTAKRQGAIVVVLTSDTDNPLKRLAEKNNLPAYFFPVTDNPSGQPRLGLGYGVGALLLLFKQLGLLSLKDKEIEAVIKQLKRKNAFYTKYNNPVQQLAKKLSQRETVLVSGSLFEGNLRTIRNQWCETAKNFASYLVLSDMNHFALEGLQYPSNNKKRLALLCLESPLYEAKMSRRLELTKEVARRNNIPVLSYTPTGQTAWAQSLDLLQFGSWLTYYLSLRNHVNPLTVPWVDWFKDQLSTK